MPTKVLLPQFGESVEEGTITRWLKAEGDTVEEFEPLVEVNTDKVDTEVPSPIAGVVLKILVEEGVTAEAGTLLAWIGERDEDVPEADLEPEQATVIAPEQPESMPVEQTAPRRPGRDAQLGFISPVVAKMVREHNLDLTQITGTGGGGRITKKDVTAYLEAGPPTETGIPARLGTAAPTAAATGAPEPALTASPGELVRLTPVRRAIAEHMVRSKHTSPHVTTVMEADLTPVVAHRAAHKAIYARDGVNLTYTAYLVAATASALKNYPLVNSSWTEGGVQLHRDINIGMATSLAEEGLIVPVIRGADGLSLLGVARAVNDLASRARGKQLQPQEVQGGTFTITNHGISGSLFATPVINQPQCAILGVGMIQKRAVVINDAIAIRPMVYISLTFDHRILDGAIADQFLSSIVQSLQNWH